MVTANESNSLQCLKTICHASSTPPPQFDAARDKLLCHFHSKLNTQQQDQLLLETRCQLSRSRVTPMARIRIMASIDTLFGLRPASP